MGRIPISNIMQVMGHLYHVDKGVLFDEYIQAWMVLLEVMTLPWITWPVGYSIHLILIGMMNILMYGKIKVVALPWITNCSSSFISHQSHCTELSLQYNGIEWIDRWAFNELISLELGKIESRWEYSLSIWLDLHHNEIEQIESRVFKMNSSNWRSSTYDW